MNLFKEYYNDIDDILKNLSLSRDSLETLIADYSIELTGVDFEYPKIVIPGNYSQGTTMLLLLYSGAYGNFPIPSSVPCCLSDKEKQRLSLDYDSWDEVMCCLENESGVLDSELVALEAQPQELQNPHLTYKELYSVVWFLLCLREELIKANYYKRDIRYNPLIQFENPMYYKEGHMVDWANTNNVILACLESIVSSITLFLNSSLVFNDIGKYDFICTRFSVKDLKTLPSFRCVTSWRARRFLYKIIGMLFDSIKIYSQTLRRLSKLKIKYSFSEYLFKPSLESLVQKIFVSISKMEDYVMYF